MALEAAWVDSRSHNSVIDATYRAVKIQLCEPQRGFELASRLKRVSITHESESPFPALSRSAGQALKVADFMKESKK